MASKVGDRRHHMDPQHEFVACRSAFLPDLEVFARSCNYKSYPVHVHDRWQLTWVLSGVIDLQHRNGSQRLRAGDAVLAPPFEPIGGHTCQGAPFGFATLQIPASLLCDWPSDRVVARRDAAALCHGLVDRLVTARSGDEQASAINDAAARFLHDRPGTLDLSGTPPRPHPAVATACALLDAADDKLPLEDLAQAIHMNHRYVISLFKHSIGVPPHQYVMARRIERARRLLNRGQALNAVAADVGFNDQSHLTHDFKRVFGVTPGAYQARHCEMNFLQMFPRAVA